MVLRDALFEWFYDEGFPSHVRLNNISGGTDLAGCFGVGNPLLPVYVGGCSGFSLGVPVEVYDSTIEGDGVKGVPVADGEPGDLVSTAAFPNMPTQFWGDHSGKKYFDAYFGRFDSKWFLTLCEAIGLQLHRRVDPRRFHLDTPYYEANHVYGSRRWSSESLRYQTKSCSVYQY
jgi:hypothetical protein